MSSYKIFTSLDETPMYASPAGNKILKWQYLNKQGELVNEERNIYAMIQSCKPLTNYKELIENYGLDSEELARGARGMYADVSQFGDSSDSYGERVSALIQELQEALGSPKPTSEVGEVGEAGAQDIGADAEVKGDVE